MLQEIFISLVLRYSKNEALAIECWREIEKKYSNRKRHYHNLSHLELLVNELKEYYNSVNDWDILLFAVFYHDIIYNVLKSDNEEKSAELAVKRLSQIAIAVDRIRTCKEHILATKTHLPGDNHDTNLFTDADLSILGQAPEIYNHYCGQIRKEYSLYPDIIYNPGRKKVLLHFLGMEKIYKTAPFFCKYEREARENMQRELASL